MKGVVWKDEALGAKFDDVEIPADLVDKAKEYREKMVEAAVELDDEVLAAYLDGNEPDEATLKRLIRKAVLTGAFYPVLCGSAFKNKGVQPLLDAVVDYLPSPVDVPAIKGIDDDGNEIVRMPTTRSRWRCWRSRSWTTRSSAPSRSAASIPACCCRGTGVINSTRDKKERIGRMLLMHANNREDIKEAYAGDIVALAGLKEARTGDTLCDPDKPVILEKMEFPEPVIEIAIEPKSKADQEKLGVALAKLAAEDPSFRVSTDQESGQTILKGMGELHLDIKVDILRRTYKVDANIGAPQVAFRERDHQAGRSRLHPQEADRRYRPVRARQDHRRAERARQGLRVRVQDRRRRGAEGIHPRRRKGHRERARLRRGRGLPGGRRQGAADRRQVSRRRLVGAGLRNRIARGASARRCRRASRCCSSRS